MLSFLVVAYSLFTSSSISWKFFYIATLISFVLYVCVCACNWWVSGWVCGQIMSMETGLLQMLYSSWLVCFFGWWLDIIFNSLWCLWCDMWLSFCSWFQDSLIKPITKILVGIAVITLLIALVVKDTPQWIKKLNILGGDFPPWVLACIVIVFTRMRKRTKDFLKKLGWWIVETSFFYISIHRQFSISLYMLCFPL